jgi:hypothetical protein
MAVCDYALSDIYFWSNFNYIYPTISGCTSRTLRQFSGQKSQLERGPNFPRRGPGMLELRNVFWNWGRKRSEKYFEPPIIAKIIFVTFFPKKRRPTHPPLFPPFTFYCKIFAYQKIFWGGPRKGRGPKFLSSPSTHPTTRYRLARPGSNTLFVKGIFQNADKELNLII